MGDTDVKGNYHKSTRQNYLILSCVLQIIWLSLLTYAAFETWKWADIADEEAENDEQR